MGASVRHFLAYESKVAIEVRKPVTRRNEREETHIVDCDTAWATLFRPSRSLNSVVGLTDLN